MSASVWVDCSDGELAVAATLGELPAFDELVRRYRRPVLAVARQIVGTESAEDVAQDAWLLAFKALPQLDDPERVAPWLYAITRRRAIRCGQKASRREESGASEFDQLILDQTPSLGGDPSEHVERDETDRAVRDAVAQLQDDIQTVMVLYYFEAMPVAPIAEFLGLTVTTVKWRLHRGRQLLKTILEALWNQEPEPSKENPYERREGQREAGSPAADPASERHQQDGPRRQPHGATGRGTRGLHPPLQLHPRAPAGAGRGLQRALCAGLG